MTLKKTNFIQTPTGKHFWDTYHICFNICWLCITMIKMHVIYALETLNEIVGPDFEILKKKHQGRTLLI